MADVLDDQGKHREAKQIYEQALSIFTEIGHEGAVTTTLNNMAYAVKDLGDLAGARKLFEKALQLSRKLGDEAREAQALNGVAIVSWRQGDLVTATKMYTDAVAIHRKRQDSVRTATVLGNLAIVLQDQGKLEEARTQFEDSLAILRKIGNKQGIARTLGNVGELLLKEGWPNRAKEKFLDQMRLAQEIQDDKQRAYALYGLAETFAAQGDLKGSRTRHEEALALRTKMGEQGLAAESRLALARLALEEQNAPLAMGEASAAEEELKKQGENDQAWAGEALRAECLIMTKKPGDAKSIVARLHAQLDRIQDIDLRLGSLAAVSKVERSLGDGNLAQEGLARVANEAEKYGYSQHQLAAEIALASGDRDVQKARTRLVKVERDARSRGLELLARHAALANGMLSPVEK